MPLKAEVYQICKDICADFPGWTFTGGIFKNKSLKFVSQELWLGFYFEANFDTPVQPAVVMLSRKVTALSRAILGDMRFTSIVDFQDIAQLLRHTKEGQRLDYTIVRNKEWLLGGDKGSRTTSSPRIIDLSETREAIANTLRDAIDFIDAHYDLSSEENFLKALPARYDTRSPKMPYREFEQAGGVVMCLVRILLGDFDFVVDYRSDAYKTIFPKSIVDLDKIITVLPELKKRYAETGSVI